MAVVRVWGLHSQAHLQAFVVSAMFWSQIDDLHLRRLVAEDRYLFRAVVAQYRFLQTNFFLNIDEINRCQPERGYRVGWEVCQTRVVAHVEGFVRLEESQSCSSSTGLLREQAVHRRGHSIFLLEDGMASLFLKARQRTSIKHTQTPICALSKRNMSSLALRTISSI